MSENQIPCKHKMQNKDEEKNPTDSCGGVAESSAPMEENSFKRKKNFKAEKSQNSNKFPSVAITNTARSPEMFILNSDCFDEIFEYLSLKDLRSIGQTCKTMQTIAGEYYKRNYKSAEKFSADNGVYTVYTDNNGVTTERIETTVFNGFMNYISHYYEKIEPLRYLELYSNKFTSLNHIYLVCLELNATKIQCLQKILPKLEIVQLRQCTMDGDFYEDFLKFCENLKQIYIQDDLGDILDENGNPWLLRSYPSLEHLQLTPRYSFQINELRTFFQQNKKIRSFSTSLRCFWENRNELMTSNEQLDVFELLILDKFHRLLINMQSVYNFLNKLHARGFFKRLHLYVKRVDKTYSEELALLDGLEKLSIVQFSEFNGLSTMVNLKEFAVERNIGMKDIEILAKSLMNLESLSIGSVKCMDILPFIQNLVKLKKIRANFHESVLDLRALNNEREKLSGGKKVTIYVPDNVFLTTKWSTEHGNTNLEFIEMKRATSYF